MVLVERPLSRILRTYSLRSSTMEMVNNNPLASVNRRMTMRALIESEMKTAALAPPSARESRLIVSPYYAGQCLKIGRAPGARNAHLARRSEAESAAAAGY